MLDLDSTIGIGVVICVKLQECSRLQVVRHKVARMNNATHVWHSWNREARDALRQTPKSSFGAPCGVRKLLLIRCKCLRLPYIAYSACSGKAVCKCVHSEQDEIDLKADAAALRVLLLMCSYFEGFSPNMLTQVRAILLWIPGTLLSYTPISISSSLALV